MKIEKIDNNIFRVLEEEIIKRGEDSDKSSFSEIKTKLNNTFKLEPIDFASEVFYVILASGFKQKTAKKYFQLIIDFLKENPNPKEEEVLKIFGNKNKIKAIMEVWRSRKKLTKEFYSLENDSEKLEFLSHLPHIGEITKYHLARNLGLNCVKYDIWIQRLAVALIDKSMKSDIDNGKLKKNIVYCCDDMFDIVTKETGEKKGYVDVVLWKACSIGLLDIDKNQDVYLRVENENNNS